MQETTRGVIMRGLAASAALGGLVWAVRRRIAVVTVTGESMRPALTSGDRLLVRRAGLSQVRLGQVVVVEKPAPDGTWPIPPPVWPGRSREWMIKRVAALPGDPWPLSPSPAPWAPEPPVPVGQPVPAGKLVVLGDNLNGSYDSRAFGYCSADRLLGVVVRRLHP